MDRYEEALERAKQLLKTSVAYDRFTIEKIFPELKGCEGERIRKDILAFIRRKGQHIDKYEWHKWIAWLEKQGEPTEINPSEFDLRLNRLLKQFETLPKVELESSLGFYLDVIQNDGTYKDEKPKFEAENWITNGEFVWLISNVGDFDYEIISPQGECVTDTISYVDEYFHLWSIKDAKEGDILACNGSIFIFKEEYMAGKPTAYCGLVDGVFHVGSDGCWTNEKCYPTTKEEQDLLFSKMKEEGWFWNPDTKELSQLKVTKKGWSEEDEEQVSIITSIVQAHCGKLVDCRANLKWLESLKERLSL